MQHGRTRHLLTALAAGLGLVSTTLVAAGFALSEPSWAVGWSLISLIYAAITYGLCAGRSWAPALAQGAALFGLVAFGQCTIAMACLLPALVVGLVLHAALLGLSAGLTDGLSGRQRWSLRFAGASLAPAALFAFAPEQAGLVMGAVLGGAGLVWMGTVGLARGRTWGLVAASGGVPMLALGVALAPSRSSFVARHFLVDRPLNPLMLDVVGAAAAGAALLAVAPFAAPVARFVFGSARPGTDK
jgi:hypothetical protein